MMVIPDSHASRITRDELRAAFERAMSDGDELHPLDVVFLPPSLYDRAAREGYNMHGYAKTPMIPTGTMHPMRMIPGVVARGGVMTDEQMKSQYAKGPFTEPPPEARLGTRKNIHGYPGTHATRKHITEKLCHGKDCVCMAGRDGKCVACADDD